MSEIRRYQKRRFSHVPSLGDPGFDAFRLILMEKCQNKMYHLNQLSYSLKLWFILHQNYCSVGDICLVAREEVMQFAPKMT